MRKRDVLVIALLVLAVLAVPAGLIAYMAGNHASRQEEQRPYEGTTRELYEEHAELLTRAAEILWAHPEFFAQYRLEWEYDAPFPVYDIRRGIPVEHPFTEEEWEILTAVVQPQRVGSIWYYWRDAPCLTFSAHTTADDRAGLLYIRREDCDAQEVAQTLRYFLQHCERYEEIDVTDWVIRYLPRTE